MDYKNDEIYQSLEWLLSLLLLRRQPKTLLTSIYSKFFVWKKLTKKIDKRIIE